MKRFIVFTLFFGVGIFHLEAQPRIKGKRLDTTQTVLGADSTLIKLVEFKDSVTSLGPAETDLRAPEEVDMTWLTLLVLSSVFVIVWAGRRAWRRRKR